MRNLMSGVLYQATPIAIYACVAPVILSIFGTDSFGQFSVFMLIQGLYVLAELGLGAAMIREGSNFRDSLEPKARELVYSVIKSIEALFIIIFIVSTSVLIVLNPISQIYDMESQISIWLGLAASMRFLTIPYRSFLISQEKHVDLSIINLIWSTIKYLIAIYVAQQMSDFKFFFITFCVSSFIEFGYYKINFDKNLSQNSNVKLGLLHFSPLDLKPVYSYSLWIAYSTVLWVIIAQIDRLVISLKIDLNAFSAYFLTSTAAAALLYISGPISQILLPKWSNNHTTQEEIISSYRVSFQLISLVYLFVAFILLFSPELLFLLWTGNTFVAQFAENHLIFFLIVNYFSAVGALMNNILLAKKETRYQAIGSTVSAILQCLIVLTSLHYGSVLDMLACLTIFRAVWFFTWGQFIFKRLLATSFIRLIKYIVMEVLISSFIFILFLNSIKPSVTIISSLVIFLIFLIILLLRILKISTTQIGKLNGA